MLLGLIRTSFFFTLPFVVHGLQYHKIVHKPLNVLPKFYSTSVSNNIDKSVIQERVLFGLVDQKYNLTISQQGKSTVIHPTHPVEIKFNILVPTSIDSQVVDIVERGIEVSSSPLTTILFTC